LEQLVSVWRLDFANTLLQPLPVPGQIVSAATVIVHDRMRAADCDHNIHIGRRTETIAGISAGGRLRPRLMLYDVTANLPLFNL
jgi:hypothetical protein